MSNINQTHLKVSDRLMLGLLTIFASLILISSFTNLGPIYLSDEVHYAAKAAHLNPPCQQKTGLCYPGM